MGTCPNCGEMVKSIGHHFRLSYCSHPTLSDETKQNIDRILVGDAEIVDMNGSAQLVISNCKKAFADYQADMLPDWLIQSRYSEEVTKKNMKYMHTIRTIPMPFFVELRNRWYRGVEREKVIPHDIEMDEEMFKLWMLSSGRIVWPVGDVDSHHYKLGCSQPEDREDFLEDLVEEVGLEANYLKNELAFRPDCNDDIREMLDEPIEGYEHKRAETKDEYYRLRQIGRRRENRGKTEANPV